MPSITTIHSNCTVLTQMNNVHFCLEPWLRRIKKVCQFHDNIQRNIGYEIFFGVYETQLSITRKVSLITNHFPFSAHNLLFKLKSKFPPTHLTNCHWQQGHVKLTYTLSFPPFRGIRVRTSCALSSKLRHLHFSEKNKGSIEITFEELATFHEIAAANVSYFLAWEFFLNRNFSKSAAKLWIENEQTISQTRLHLSSLRTSFENRSERREILPSRVTIAYGVFLHFLR